MRCGDQIGVYKIERRLGIGGMGVVYQATHQMLKRTVALKVMSSNGLQHEELARFQREMAMSGQLNSPNIVVTHDAGESNGLHFIAMELVDGADLGKIAVANAPLSVGSATELICQAAIGLNQAHEIGLVHRDIKPSNLMLSEDGVVKVLDLGLAKLQSKSDQDEITQSKQIMGTVDYMASEQCKESRSADIRSDIYSLGATLYHLLSGHPPYSGPTTNTTFEKLTALATEDPPSIATRRDDLPTEVVAIVDKMTRRDPEQRFQQPSEVAEALTSFADPSELSQLLVKASEIPNSFVEEQAHRDTSRTDFNRTLIAAAKQLQLERSTTGTAKAVQTKANLQKARLSRTKRMAWLIALCLGIAAIAFALTKLRIETPSGDIVIRTVGGDTEINVLGDTASFIDPSDGKKVTVAIDREKQMLRFSKDGFKAIGESFELGNSEQKVSIAFEPAKDSNTESMPADAPVHAIAAFDSQQGFSYVFYNNGLYDKILNKTNQKLHQLDTNHYWRHTMQGGRELRLNAILALDADYSLIFFDDGMIAKYHNASRIEVDMRKDGLVDDQGNQQKRSGICASIHLPDERRLLFYKNGMCSRFDADMKLVESISTEELFPNLKAKSQMLTAARVDPITQLAFFYFRDGTHQVFDTIENKLLRVVSAGDKPWRVPREYFAREKPRTQIVRSTSVELVEWCFQHGMTELICLPNNKLVIIDKTEDFSLSLEPPIGATINTDIKDAYRVLVTVIRYNLHNTAVKFDRLKIHGSNQIPDEFLDELNIPNLRSLAIECPITNQQLAEIKVRAIELFSLSHATDAKLATIAERFPNLKTLSIDASQVSETGLNSLSKLPSLSKLILSSSNFDETTLEQFRKNHPSIKVTVGD